jgi:vaccinia related kinase
MAGRPKAKNTNGKVRIADNGYRLPDQLPNGELLIDSLKNEWVLGKAIARGGFGEIYEARPSLIKSNLSIKKNKDYEYVIKVDHFQGPLFCEMNFYIRVGKQEQINKWMNEKGMYF